MLDHSKISPLGALERIEFLLLEDATLTRDPVNKKEVIVLFLYLFKQWQNSFACNTKEIHRIVLLRYFIRLSNSCIKFYLKVNKEKNLKIPLKIRKKVLMLIFKFLSTQLYLPVVYCRNEKSIES